LFPTQHCLRSCANLVHNASYKLHKDSDYFVFVVKEVKVFVSKIFLNDCIMNLELN